MATHFYISFLGKSESSIQSIYILFYSSIYSMCEKGDSVYRGVIVYRGYSGRIAMSFKALV